MTTCGSPTRLGAIPARVKLPSEVEPEASRATTLISTSVCRSVTVVKVALPLVGGVHPAAMRR